MSIKISESYVPSEDEEEYMNPFQIEYFRRVLLNLREIMNAKVLSSINDARSNFERIGNDFNDNAISFGSSEMHLVVGDRCRKLINEIDLALEKIELNEYGYCAKTGEEIGIERLKANPTAAFCVEAQEEMERKKRA